MGREDKVGCIEKMRGAFNGDGRRCEDIDGGTEQMACLNPFGDGGLVDDAALAGLMRIAPGFIRATAAVSIK